MGVGLFFASIIAFHSLVFVPILSFKEKPKKCLRDNHFETNMILFKMFE